MMLPAAILAFGVAAALAAQTNPQDQPDSKSAFHAKAVSHTGTIRLAGAIEKVFPLFGPVREKDWAPGWDPEIVYPAGAEVSEGMVFRTHDKSGETFWVITHFDEAGHSIAYANVTPGYIVNRIMIHCTGAGANETECSVTYAHVALSEHANNFIEHMDDKAYAAKMAHWQEAINHRLTTGKTIEMPR
jgi:hypothetical protein